MPAEAPVTRAVPFPLFLLTFSLLFALVRGFLEERSGLEDACLQRHISSGVGHTSGVDMQRIGFVVYPGYQAMGFAALSVFEFTNVHLGERRYDVEVLSEARGPVVTSAGIPVVTQPFDDSDFDTLIVGGSLEIAPSSPGLLEFLRRAPG